MEILISQQQFKLMLLYSYNWLFEYTATDQLSSAYYFLRNLISHAVNLNVRSLACIWSWCVLSDDVHLLYPQASPLRECKRAGPWRSTKTITLVHILDHELEMLVLP